MKNFLSEPPSSSTKYLLIVKEVAVYDECVKSKWRICQSLLPIGTPLEWQPNAVFSKPVIRLTDFENRCFSGIEQARLNK